MTNQVSPNQTPRTFPVGNRHNNRSAIPDSKDKLQVVERGNAEVKLTYVVGSYSGYSIPLTKQAHWDATDPMIRLGGVEELPHDDHRIRAGFRLHAHVDTDAAGFVEELPDHWEATTHSHSDGLQSTIEE